jgi:hypothetical protein
MTLAIVRGSCASERRLVLGETSPAKQIYWTIGYLSRRRRRNKWALEVTRCSPYQKRSVAAGFRRWRPSRWQTAAILPLRRNKEAIQVALKLLTANRCLASQPLIRFSELSVVTPPAVSRSGGSRSGHHPIRMKQRARHGGANTSWGHISILTDPRLAGDGLLLRARRDRISKHGDSPRRQTLGTRLYRYRSSRALRVVQRGSAWNKDSSRGGCNRGENGLPV